MHKGVSFGSQFLVSQEHRCTSEHFACDGGENTGCHARVRHNILFRRIEAEQRASYSSQPDWASSALHMESWPPHTASLHGGVKLRTLL